SCTPLDQLGQTRVDGDGDGPAVCDIGAIEFQPSRVVVNNLVTLNSVTTSFNPTPVHSGPAGTFTIVASFTNTSAKQIGADLFVVTELTNGNSLLNADGGPGGVGAKLTPDVGADGVLSPGESFRAKFEIGLQARAHFTFLVDLLGVPGP